MALRIRRPRARDGGRLRSEMAAVSARFQRIRRSGASEGSVILAGAEKGAGVTATEKASIAWSNRSGQSCWRTATGCSARLTTPRTWSRTRT
jgi:hypothetical protein